MVVPPKLGVRLARHRFRARNLSRGLALCARARPERHFLQCQREQESEECECHSPQEHGVQRVGEGVEKWLVNLRRQQLDRAGRAEQRRVN